MRSADRRDQLSIVVVYHNEEENLPSLVQSLVLETEKQENFHFIFIDNASTDQSADFVESVRKQFINFTHVHRTKNHMAEARQQGLAIAESAWVAYIDADTQLCRGWARGVSQALEQIPTGAGAIGGFSGYVASAKWHKFVAPFAKMFPLGHSNVEICQVDHVPTNNYILNRQVALDVGGFHPFFNRVGEDLEFNVRLRKKYSIHYTSFFAVTHRLPIKKRAWYSKMLNYGCAQSYVASLHKGGVHPAKVLPGLLLLIMTGGVVLFPFYSFLVLAIGFVIPRLSFSILTVASYGLGEWLGLGRAIKSGLIFHPKHKIRPSVSVVDHLGLP